MQMRQILETRPPRYANGARASAQKGGLVRAQRQARALASLTAVGVAMDSGAHELAAVLIRTPALPLALVTLQLPVISVLVAAGDVHPWKTARKHHFKYPSRPVNLAPFWAKWVKEEKKRKERRRRSFREVLSRLESRQWRNQFREKRLKAQTYIRMWV